MAENLSFRPEGRPDVDALAASLPAAALARAVNRFLGLRREDDEHARRVGAALDLLDVEVRDGPPTLDPAVRFFAFEGPAGLPLFEEP